MGRRAAQLLDVFVNAALSLSETKSGANTLALILALRPSDPTCVP
jgi:hypothetical protein